jgi:hypothetical protein
LARLSKSAWRGLVVLGALSLLTAALIAFPRLGGAPAFDPFAAVPRSAAVLVHVDVKQIARSSLKLDWSQVEPSLPKGRSLATLCKFDPLKSLDRLVIVIPKRGTPSGEVELGLAATGTIDSDSVLECAERVLGARRRTPVRARLDSFQSVRARDGGDVEVAVRDGGPLLVASGATLRDMIDAVEGRSPNVNDASIHRELSGISGHAVAATAEVDPHWFDGMTHSPGVRSPFLDVSSASVAVDVGPPLRFIVQIRCTARSTAESIERMLTSLGKSIGPSLREEFGVTTDAASISTRERSVHAVVTLSADSAERLIKKLLAGDVDLPDTSAGASSAPGEGVAPPR